MAETLVLDGTTVRSLLTLDECIAEVEGAFRDQAHGQVLASGVLGIHAARGSFHAKAAGLTRGSPFFAIKLNANFPENPKRFDLPTIQGVVALFDGENGRVLALMDSIEITTLRTGAATAVAAKRLARPESRVAAIFGCGRQGRVQLRSLTRVLPIRVVRAFDLDSTAAAAFAAEMAAELGLEIRVCATVSEAARDADVLVAGTTAHTPYLLESHVARGAFIAAVGADNPEKLEIHPDLMARSIVVTDVLEQCAAMGDLRGAIAACTMRREDVHAELGAVVVGGKNGRTNADEIIVFDSTGTAIQDVAAAVAVYGKAVDLGRGFSIDLAAHTER